MSRLTNAINTINALGKQNLSKKGVVLSEDATTYEIMQGIADVSGGAKSYADAIYEYYSIDKATYPCLAIAVYENSSKTRLIFSAEPLNATDTKAYSHYTTSVVTGLVGETDAGVVFGWLKGRVISIPSLTEASWHLTEGVYFANYPIEETETIKYYPL